MQNSLEIHQSIPIDVFLKTERAKRLSHPKPDHATKGALTKEATLFDRRNDIREKALKAQIQEALLGESNADSHPDTEEAKQESLLWAGPKEYSVFVGSFGSPATQDGPVGKNP